MYVCERVKRYLVVCGEGVGAGVARRRRSAAQQLRLGMAEVQHQSGTTTATAAAVVAVVVVVVAVVVAVVAVIVIVVAGAMATEAVVGRLVGCAGCSVAALARWNRSEGHVRVHSSTQCPLTSTGWTTTPDGRSPAPERGFEVPGPQLRQ